jgi:short-subunit dehydrogenase
MNSEKRYALISGASSGIGWEFTKLLAEKLYHTIMVSNQEELLKEKCELI